MSFVLTKRQQRQQRKAIFCSRTCARKNQHQKNHAAIRKEKNCEQCKTTFIVANWNDDKRFCSIKCSSRTRFKTPESFINGQSEKLARMVGDEKYYRWLETQAKRFGLKFNVEWQDLLQEFLLSIAEGKTGKFEFVFFESIRRSYKRGITGSHKAIEIAGGEEMLASVRDNRKQMSAYQFAEYLADLRRITSDTEYQLTCMYLCGFDKGEIFENSKELSRRELVALWKRLGIEGRIREL